MAEEEKEAAAGARKNPLDNKAVLLGVIVTVQAVLAIVITQFMIVPAMQGRGAAAAGPAASALEASAEMPEIGAIVSLGEIVVTLQSDRPDIPSYLRITVALEVEDQVTVDLVTERLPLLRDLVIMALSTRKGSEMITVEGKQAVRTEIMRRLADKLPPGQLKSVYFSDLVVQ